MRRRREIQAPVRTVPVAVIDERPQHPLQVPALDDQNPVRALPSHGADDPLGDRVRLGRLGGGPDDPYALGAEDITGVEVLEGLGIGYGKKGPTPCTFLRILREDR